MYKSIIMRFLGAIQIDRNMFIVTYYIGGSIYKFPVFMIRTKKIVTCVYDSAKKDITNMVLPYLGPSLDCHRVGLCAEFFGKKEITIVYEDIDSVDSSLQEKTFSEREEIIL